MIQATMGSDSVDGRPVVAMIGGGLSGAATAFHLARLSDPRKIDIVVIEPRAELGHGLAYSTTEPAHRINVPASKMTLISNDVAHFEKWLATEDAPALDTEARAANGDSFPQRRIFGRYVESHLRPYLESGAIRHVSASVIEVRRMGQVYRLGLSDGGSIDADCIVMATTHPLPKPPGSLDALRGAKGLVSDPYDLERIYAIPSTDDVLVVGTGLTSADVIATLDRQRHQGRILALSRHGLRSREHAGAKGETEADFAVEPSRNAIELLRRIRAEITADAARGVAWQAAMDRVRTQGTDIWQALPPCQRRVVVRHLRTIWDVHRFRISPQIAQVLDRRVKEGSLRYEAASLVSSAKRENRLEVCYRPRHSSAIVRELFDTIIVTTGPAHSDIMRSNLAIGSLGRLGLVTPDPLGLGLATGARSQAIGITGELAADIFVAGPLARGSYGELMGLPEVTAHAESVAAEVHRWAGQVDTCSIATASVD